MKRILLLLFVLISFFTLKILTMDPENPELCDVPIAKMPQEEGFKVAEKRGLVGWLERQINRLKKREEGPVEIVVTGLQEDDDSVRKL